MKKNRYSLATPLAKAAPNSPLEKHLLADLLSRIRARSVYGSTKQISGAFHLRHALVVRTLHDYATEDAGYTSGRPAKRHKIYRPRAPRFCKGTVNCYWA